MFDAYRQFYRNPPDLAIARRFLANRFIDRQSIIFIATHRQVHAALDRVTNSTAQALYEREGRLRETEFFVYNMRLA